MSFGTSSLRSYFHLHQLGIGIPVDCEAAINSERRYLEAMPTDHVLVKRFHQRIQQPSSSWYALCSLQSSARNLYLLPFWNSSILFHGSYTVSSQEGPQQGDPKVHLLFCNTIQPMLSSVESELNLWFFDDVFLNGPVGTVAVDVARIAKEDGEMGLHLNP